MIPLHWDSLPNFRYNAVIVYNFSIKSKLIFISKTKKSAICLPNIHQINTHHFIVLQPLLKDVWAGDYSLLKPLTFKECLSNTHPQFSGSHQHDCQEFLALLLGTMHEELRSLKGYCKNKSMQYESECGTSMELHTG